MQEEGHKMTGSLIFRPAFEASSIGFQFASGLSSRFASSFETVWSAPPRLTSKNSVSLFLQALAVGTFARRVEGTSLSQERIQLGLGGAVSPFPGRPFGTPYRGKFDKLWTMLNCLRKSWKHFICWSNSNTSVDSYRKSVPHQSINQSITENGHYNYLLALGSKMKQLRIFYSLWTSLPCWQGYYHKRCVKYRPTCNQGQ